MSHAEDEDAVGRTQERLRERRKSTAARRSATRAGGPWPCASSCAPLPGSRAQPAPPMAPGLGVTIHERATPWSGTGRRAARGLVLLPRKERLDAAACFTTAQAPRHGRMLWACDGRAGFSRLRSHQPSIFSLPATIARHLGPRMSRSILLALDFAVFSRGRGRRARISSLFHVPFDFEYESPWSRSDTLLVSNRPPILPARHAPEVAWGPSRTTSPLHGVVASAEQPLECGARV